MINNFIKKYQKKEVKQYPNKVLNKPLVSVCVQTYQHANYIKQCLDGILMQKTTFPFEILLGEDNSTDGTREICLEYAKKYPKKIRLFLHARENNIKINGQPTGRFNFVYNLFSAKGKYIALCEGDDYWTDPLKLQKQVDFLEKNFDYNMTLGRTKKYDENSKSFRDISDFFNINKQLTLKNYIAYNFAHTSTFLFRNNFILPDWFSKVHAGDQTIFIIATANGKIKYFKDFFSVYRINPMSISFKADSEIARQKTRTFLNYIDQYTNGKYKLLITNRRILNYLYYYFATANNRIIRISIKTLMFVFRWVGINVLVKFIKN